MSTARGDLNKLVRTDIGNVRQSQDGLYRGRVEYAVSPYSAAEALAPKRNRDVHPFYRFMVAKEVEIVFEKPDAAVIFVDYEGLLDYDDDTPPEVDYRPSMREVPIMEHPKFEEWAGTPDEPNEGVFDPRTQAFLGWKPDSDLYMIDSFLYPGMTASVTTVENNEPKMSELGERERKPKHLVAAGDDREWMTIGVPHRNFEDPETGREKWLVTREYLLSNPGKFNEKVYDEI